jgi:uncharacterized protein YggE
VVDIAVAAGATNVEGVDWEVRDPQALEAQAYGAAIERARKIAAQSGVKLGEIVSVVNSANRFVLGTVPLDTSTVEVSGTAGGNYRATVPLTLYPPKIERQASVTVTYAISQ